MRRIIVLTCAVPALIGAAAIAGTAVATDVGEKPGRAAPAPAVSPPLGDDYYMASDLMKGLPEVGELPEGWTLVSDGGDSIMQVPIFGSTLCGGMGGSIWGPVTSVERVFRHRDGGRLRIEITANGRDFAAGVVKDTADALTECPTVTGESGGVTRHAKLSLPTIGDASAGLTSVVDGDPPRRSRTAVVAWGPAYVGIEETGAGAGGEARFVEIVTTAARTVPRIASGPDAEELRRGLVELEDLPDGFRQLTDRTADNREFFEEYGCDGRPVGYGTPGVAVHRTFTRGDAEGPIVESIVGTTVQGNALAAAVSGRFACPTITDESGRRRVVTDLRTPATDITIRGILYRDDPVRARAVILYRDVVAEIWVTKTAGLTMPEIEKIVDTALGEVFDVYHG
jgi:hypothetical protein